MCIGESASDTLDVAEQVFLEAATRTRLSGYDAQAQRNDDAMAWIVIVPQASTMPRFTICRIDPSVLVMVEDPSRRRRFSSAANVEDAIAFVCRTASEANRALDNVHAAPELAQ